MSEQMYGDWLLEKRGLKVIEGGQQDPDVPDDFDPNSLKPIRFVFKDHELYINGLEMQRRAVEELNAPYGRKLLWWLLNHQDQIPEEWKRVSFIVFVGDYDLRDPVGNKCVLWLDWRASRWIWGKDSLDHSYWPAHCRILAPCQ